MPKNATIMQARRKCLCPEGGRHIESGQTIKVYNDEWFHLYPCWDDMWKTIIAKRDYEDYQEMDKYKNKSKIRIKPVIENVSEDAVALESLIERVIKWSKSQEAAHNDLIIWLGHASPSKVKEAYWKVRENE